jgi:hypothetical protein
MLPVYRVRAKEHKLRPLWEECLLQTYFTARGCIDYFVVVEAEAKGRQNKGALACAISPVLLAEKEKTYFEELEKDHQKTKDDVIEQASIVYDFGDSKSARVLRHPPEEDLRLSTTR